MEEIGIELDCEDVVLVEEGDPMFELLCQPGKLSEVENSLTNKGSAFFFICWLLNLICK